MPDFLILICNSSYLTELNIQHCVQNSHHPNISLNRHLEIPLQIKEQISRCNTNTKYMHARVGVDICSVQYREDRSQSTLFHFCYRYNVHTYHCTRTYIHSFAPRLSLILTSLINSCIHAREGVYRTPRAIANVPVTRLVHKAAHRQHFWQRRLLQPQHPTVIAPLRDEENFAPLGQVRKFCTAKGFRKALPLFRSLQRFYTGVPPR